MNAIAARRAGKSLRLTVPSRHPAVFIATFGYLGHLPVVARNTHLGSLGMSLLTPLLFWPIILLYGLPAALLVLAIGNLLGTCALDYIDEHGTKSDHDSRAIVIDEFIGAGLAACLMLPLLWNQFHVEAFTMQLASCLLVGLLFRIFDIAKFTPASIIDLHWHAPYAVIADDLVAGLQTVLVLALFCLIV